MPSVATVKTPYLAQMGLEMPLDTTMENNAKRSDETCHGAEHREADNGLHTLPNQT
jgi:hypothetical protein